MNSRKQGAVSCYICTRGGHTLMTKLDSVKYSWEQPGMGFAQACFTTLFGTHPELDKCYVHLCGHTTGTAMHTELVWVTFLLDISYICCWVQLHPLQPWPLLHLTITYGHRAAAPEPYCSAKLWFGRILCQEGTSAADCPEAQHPNFSSRRSCPALRSPKSENQIRLICTRMVKCWLYCTQTWSSGTMDLVHNWSFAAPALKLLESFISSDDFPSV